MMQFNFLFPRGPLLAMNIDLISVTGNVTFYETLNWFFFQLNSRQLGSKTLGNDVTAKFKEWRSRSLSGEISLVDRFTQ